MTKTACLIGILAFLNCGNLLRGEVASGGDTQSDESAASDSDKDAGSSMQLLNKAHTLLVQAASLAGSPSNNSERKKLLFRAKRLIWKVPPDEKIYHGFRKAAMLDVDGAIKEEQKGNSNQQLIADHLKRANAELRSAISAEAKTETNP